MSEDPRWWRNPGGIVSALTIATVILSFFYIREKAMWDVSNRIEAVERRGESAILAAGQRMERMESFTGSIRDQVNFLERKIDRLELHDAQQEKDSKSYEH